MEKDRKPGQNGKNRAYGANMQISQETWQKNHERIFGKKPKKWEDKK